MLRPERMSKVSVTGAKAVMPDVIRAVHELNLVHLSDYDGSWEGFDNGNPIEGAEEASERLVTIRSLERAVDLSADDEIDPISVDRETLDDRLADAREDITSTEDRMAQVRENRREIQDRIDRMAPFAAIGIDLDLYHGHSFLEVAVGTGPRDEIDTALADAEDIAAFETFEGDDAIAIFARAADGADSPISDALVGIEFSQLEIPEGAGNPESTIAELRSERNQLDSELRSLEAELERLKHEYGGFLLGADRELSIDVQRAEAPLQFATTERAFVAEGWIPSARYEELVSAVRAAVGERVEVEEIYRAEHTSHGHELHEATEDEAVGGSPEGGPAATDGGVVTVDDDPPVVLRNPDVARPFELLTNMVNRPRYSELDPTLAVFLTFPIAFGFMIGDIGYGVLYILMGWYLLQYDSRGYQAVGMIAAWCGVFTVIFGWLYDDTFGVHLLDYDLAIFQFMELFGLGFLSKGIQSPEWLMTWILASLFFGWLHLNIGLVIRFVNELAHGWRAAIMEGGSWLLAMNGALIWLFSHQDAGWNLGMGTDLTASGAKPAEFFGAESVIAHTGFIGFPEALGVAGLVLFVVGLVLVGVGEGIAGLAESPAWVLGHFLSYLRVVAVLLGKGAMAFVVNLIVFGAYITETGYVVFNLPGGTPEAAAGAGVGIEEVAFAGVWNMDPLLIPIAIAIFIVGHIIVLLLGITAAGIQMLRLEYVEFFQKFFEGGGREYRAFGSDPEAATR